MSAVDVSQRPVTVAPAPVAPPARTDRLIVLPEADSPTSVPRPTITKRVVDLVVATTLLVLLAPVLLVLAVAVGATSRGGVFYRQDRFARGGGTFTMYKFRSMYVDADARLEELLASDPALAEEYRTTVKLRRDPRITPVGRFLRRTSLDELPQLFNVCLGDMSIVGPRPIRDVDLPHYGNAVADMLSVRPGLTGLWQVSGRCELSMEQRVQLDVWYARSHGLAQDLEILLRTPAAVVRGTGAW